MSASVENHVVSLLIPSAVLEKVMRRLSKLAKNAGTELLLIPGETAIAQKDAPESFVQCARVSVGELPRVAGWTLVGRIEHTEAGNITAAAPGETIPEQYRNAEPSCTHCGHKRMRKETFLLRATDGSLVQIGRNCLADFLTVSPERMIAQAALADACNEPGWEEYARGNFRDDLTVERFVACAYASVEEHGFRKSTEEGATVADALHRAYPPGAGSSSNFKQMWREAQPTADQTERTVAAIAWARASADSGDYLYNLRIAATLPYVGKHAGLLASLPSAHMRELGKDLAKRQRAAMPDPGYLGTIGKRIEFEATFLRLNIVEGRYGSVAICGFVTDEGHELVWFASGEHPTTGLLGKTFKVKATIKRHELRNGRHQTTLSRAKCQMLSEEPLIAT
jgi:hypothetical protein